MKSFMALRLATGWARSSNINAASVFHLLWLRAGRLTLFLRRQVLRLYCCWFLKPGAVLWPWGTNRRWGLKGPWEWFWPRRLPPWLCLKPNLCGSNEPWESDLMAYVWLCCPTTWGWWSWWRGLGRGLVEFVCWETCAACDVWRCTTLMEGGFSW